MDPMHIKSILASMKPVEHSRSTIMLAPNDQTLPASQSPQMNQRMLDTRVRLAVDRYMAGNPSPAARQELLRYLEARPVLETADPIIPIAGREERLGLISEIQAIYDKSDLGVQHTYDGRFHFTILQMSYLLLLPIERLRELAKHAMAHYLPWLDLEAYINFMVRGQIRRITLTDEYAPTQSLVDSMYSKLAGSPMKILPSLMERYKCISRDRGACVLTKAACFEVCYITPPEINASEANLAHYRAQNYLTMSLQGDRDFNAPQLLGSEIGCSDKAWNMICLHPTLQGWWSRRLFGLKWLGPVSASNDFGDCTIQLQFHWMPVSDVNPRDYTRSSHDIIEKVLRARRQEPFMTAETRGFPSGCLQTGQVFRLTVLQADVAKMKAMIDIQWANTRLAAISGIAGNWELLDAPPPKHDTISERAELCGSTPSSMTAGRDGSGC